MTQDQLTLLLLKIVLPAAVMSLLGWVWIYGRLQPWWHDQIGVTLVVKSTLLAVQLVLLSLALYIHLRPPESRVVAWAYVVCTAAIAPVMIWRTVVWVKASRQAPGKDAEQCEEPSHRA